MTETPGYIPAAPPPRCLMCSCELAAPGEHAGDGARIFCSRCGTYRVSGTLEAMILNGSLSVDPLVSSWIRRRADAGEEPLITSDTINEIVDSLPRYSVPQKVNVVLRFLADRTQVPGQAVPLHLELDGSLVWVASAEEFDYYLATLAERSLIRRDHRRAGEPTATVSAKGWDHLDTSDRSGALSRRAFVAMWFAEEMRDVHEAGLRPAIEDAGFEAYRVDDHPHGDRIDARITNAIEESRFLVVDVTGQRQSVYFEAGYALGLNKPVIWTVRQDDLEKAAFDTRQFPHIVWESPADLRRQLRDLIRARIT